MNSLRAFLDSFFIYLIGTKQWQHGRILHRTLQFLVRIHLNKIFIFRNFLFLLNKSLKTVVFSSSWFCLDMALLWSPRNSTLKDKNKPFLSKHLHTHIFLTQYLPLSFPFLPRRCCFQAVSIMESKMKTIFSVEERARLCQVGKKHFRDFASEFS